MYINKNIILLLIMLFSFNACNKIADGPSYEAYLKGNSIRAFDVINDTLFGTKRIFVIQKSINY